MLWSWWNATAPERAAMMKNSSISYKCCSEVFKLFVRIYTLGLAMWSKWVLWSGWNATAPERVARMENSSFSA